MTPTTADVPSRGLAARLRTDARSFAILGVTVFLAGILALGSRHAFSVSFWPANALMVGLVLRDRRLFSVAGWAGALFGFVGADLLFGRTLSLAAFFATANLTGTFVAALLLRPLDLVDLRLRRAHSVLKILIRLLPASFAAGACGAVLVVVEFHGSALQALATWPASELVNYLTVLPAVLTLRGPIRLRAGGRLLGMSALREAGPALFLAVSCLAAVLFDGPGSIVFPLPALLLCALSYSIPTTCVMTMLFGTTLLTLIGWNVIDLGQDMSLPQVVVSMRIAVAFLVIVPLTIGSAMAVRNDLLHRLRDAADHDGLTGLLNRRAFEDRMGERLLAGSGRLILWLDIDRFKAINDRHGHQAGDAVLRAFADTARNCCRSNDLVGRIGGEEFALILNVPDAQAARTIAERLHATFASSDFRWNGVSVHTTASIGAAYLVRPVTDVNLLTRHLDEALYRAKRKGRNRIEWLDEDWDLTAGQPEQSLRIAAG